MKRKTLLIIALISMLAMNAIAQDEWEPQLNVTGYINTIAEFTNQQQYKDINRNIGIGLAEVGLLTSYRPLEKLELKSTLVYKHTVPDIQSMVVEAYGIYTFDEKFKVGLGKFLTPLSPVNVYFYAPVNPSVVLPMVISHHFLTPQSISGIQFVGTFGDELKLDYNLTYGNYTTLGHVKGGIIGLMGSEDLAQISAGGGNSAQIYDLGGSARIAANYRDKVSLGLNYFDGTRATLNVLDATRPGGGPERFFKSSKWSSGVDFHLNFDEKFKINAEYWIGKNETTELVDKTPLTEEVVVDYDGFYVEAIYSVGKFTPYVRYEELTDLKGLFFAGNPLDADPTGGVGTPLGPWGTNMGTGDATISSIGAGVAYRPMYELLLKMDYRSLKVAPNALAENALGVGDDSFSHLVFSAVFSF